MHWIESRIKLVEERVEYLYRQLQAVLQQVRAALNQLNQVGGSGGGGSGSGSVYTCSPSGTIAAGGSLGGQTVNLYQAGSNTALTGTYTIYNPMGGATVVTKTLIVLPDGLGNFVAITQSCS